MKKLTKKSFLQKTIIVVLMVLCINFIVPTYSHADFGGVLFDPIADVLCSIGDAVIYLVEGAMTGTWGDDVSLGDGGFLVKDSDFWNNSEYSNMQTSATGTDIDPDEEFSKGWLGLDNSYYIPVTTYSPEQIFAGSVSGLDINFINPDQSKWGTTTDKEGNTIVDSSSGRLQTTIASWYVALRNLSVVGLLSVLVYVGIRIIISSTAADKAKYKQLLVDWLIALCILFFLHYIMSFTVTMVDSVCSAIGSGEESVSIATTDGTLKTNLLGAARFKTQYKDFGAKVSYLIAYLALVVYTLIFTWFYLKRLLMMAFLTLIAPLVALTYPIDKIQDGKAQAFNSWLKEYVFNALIQPFHLIIYMVFVGAAMDLAESNIIYMIAALGFILPAEKILRKFFGFDKAGATLGSLVGGAAIGSMAAKGIKSLAGGGSKGGSKGGSGNTKQIEADKGVRYQKSNGGLAGAGLESLMGGSSNDGQNTPKSRENSNQLNEKQEETQGTGDPELDYYMNQIRQGNEMGKAGLKPIYNLADDVDKGKFTEAAKRVNQEEFNKKKEELANKGMKLNEDGSISIPMSGGSNNSALQGARNLARYHTYGKGTRMINGAGRAIKGAAKFATRTSFKLAGGFALGAIPAAVAAASGGGIAGAAAAFATAGAIGARAGGSLADDAMGVVGAIPGAVRRNVDIFNGNNNMQKAFDVKQQMKDEKHMAYVKSMMEKEGWRDKNGNMHEAGEIASRADVKERMKRYEGYFQEGLDIDTATKAQKTADKYEGVNDEMMAKVAGDALKNEINKGTFHDKKKLEAQWNDEYNNNISAGKSAEVATKATDAKFALLADMNNTSYTPKSASNVLKKQQESIERLQNDMADMQARQRKMAKGQATQASEHITGERNSNTSKTTMGPISSSMNRKGSITKGMKLNPGEQGKHNN